MAHQEGAARIRGAGVHQWVAGRVSGARGMCLGRGAAVVAGSDNGLGEGTETAWMIAPRLRACERWLEV